jgi:mevalonate kinase
MAVSNSPRICASAPGKIILFGEHFVVFNTQAVVAAIDKRCYGRAEFIDRIQVRIYVDDEENLDPFSTHQHVTKGNVENDKVLLAPLNGFCQNILRKKAPKSGLQIYIKSDLPVGFGLGSSAALCVMLAGIFRLVIEGDTRKELSTYDRKWIFENALNGEQLFHSRSSGVDCYVSTYGGLVHYAGLTGTSSVKNQPLPLYLVNTHLRHETSELVSHVRGFSENKPKYFRELTSAASMICSSGVSAIEKGSLEEIGRLMTENHKLLTKIGVSNNEIEKIIEICTRSGSLGAKITGAGGGGCILVLARPTTIPALKAALAEFNLSLETINIDNKGLLID